MLCKNNKKKEKKNKNKYDQCTNIKAIAIMLLLIVSEHMLSVAYNRHICVVSNIGKEICKCFCLICVIMRISCFISAN